MADFLLVNAEALRRAGDPLSPVPAVLEARLSESDGALVLRTADGRAVRLHSARDPGREAVQQVGGIVTREDTVTVAVLGAGHGYVLDVLEHAPSSQILVIEPFADAPRWWLKRRSWVSLIEAGRLRVLTGPDYLESRSVSQWLRTDTREIPVIANPVLLREYPEAMADARHALDRVIRDALANANARARFEDVAFTNTLSNLPAVLREADVGALFGAFAGVPAIVIGAGPSLDHNLPAIARAQHAALVVCADTALQPCATAGVVPHLVVSLDPSTLNARHLTWGGRPASTSLVCEAAVDPAAVQAFPDRTFFFRVGNHAPWPWLRQNGLDRSVLDVWGSVVTGALDVAVRAGCSPIVFAGLDLACTGGRPYCRHTSLEEAWAREVVKGRSLDDVWSTWMPEEARIDEPDLFGQPTPTAKHLVAFRDWLVQYIASHPDITFINATGGGILRGKGITCTSLDGVDALRTPLPAGRLLHALEARHRSADPDASLARRIGRALSEARLDDLLEGHHDAARLALTNVPAALAADVSSALLRPAPAAEARVAGTSSRRDAPTVPILDHLPFWRSLQATGETVRPLVLDEEQQTRIRANLRAAYRLLQDLSESRPLVPDPENTIGNLTWWDLLPAHALLPWPHNLRPLVHDFAAALLDAIRAANTGAAPIGTRPVGPSYWTAPAEATVDAWTLVQPRVATDRLATDLALSALAAQWMLVASELLDAPAWSQRLLAEIAGQMMRRWQVGSVDGAPTLHMAGDTAIVGEERGRAVLVIPDPEAAALMRAVTGRIVASAAPSARAEDVRERGPLALTWQWTHGPAFPYNTFLDRAPALEIEPDILTGRGLTLCYLATTLDERCVLVTRADGRGSYRVDDEGRVEESREWPKPIATEAPLPDGGRIAWGRTSEGWLLHRSGPDAEATVHELSWQPYDMCVTEGGLVWFASDEGLWHWNRADGARLAVRGPALVAVHAAQSGLRAYGLPSLAPDGRRRVIDTAYDWSPGQPELTTSALQPGHAILSIAGRRGWRAEAWTDASLIRLLHESGSTFWLACPSPRAVAWAGESLVATVLPDGHVLRFAHLARRLDAVTSLPE